VKLVGEGEETVSCLDITKIHPLITQHWYLKILPHEQKKPSLVFANMNIFFFKSMGEDDVYTSLGKIPRK